MADWIACSERLPEKGVDVLVWIVGGIHGPVHGIGCLSMKFESWVTTKGTRSPSDVTHWQPMPPPPAQPQRGEGAG